MISRLHVLKTAGAARAFHTTRPAALDLFSFFRGSNKTPAALKPVAAEKPKKTKALLAELEAGDATDARERSTAARLDVIGAPAADDSWAREHNGFSMAGAFPVHTHKPELDMETVTAAIAEAAGVELAAGADEASIRGALAAHALPEFGARLAFVAAVSRALGVAVPDSRLAALVDAAALRDHFAAHVAGVHYNPREPDAIYLNPADYEGSNITILPTPATKADRKKRWNKLVAEARIATESRVQQQLDSAMN